MKEFDFYQDVKVITWCRQKFSVEANSKEEAIKIASKYKNVDIACSEDSFMIYDTEWITEAWEHLPVESNNGFPTIELYDNENGNFIGNNED